MRSPDRPGRVLAVATGLWLGSIVLSGAVAGVAFPAMKALGPALPGLPGVKEPWLVAAGVVARGGFRVATWVELLSAAAALVALVATREASMGRLVLGRLGPARRPRAGLASLGLVVALLTLLASVALQWRMNSQFDAYLAAARVGESTAGDASLAAFRSNHTLATTLLAVQAGGCVLSLLGQLWPGRRS